MQNRKRDTDVQNSLLDSVGEGEGGMFQENSIETCILSRVKQITSPGWMHETSVRTWCTGKTQRDRVEREVGGGIGMGNTCKPMAVSFPCMKKSTTKKKRIQRHEAYFVGLLTPLSKRRCLCGEGAVCLHKADLSKVSLASSCCNKQQQEKSKRWAAVQRRLFFTSCPPADGESLHPQLTFHLPPSH